MIWDVAIIGSGPAGSATAIHCRNAGVRTAIFTSPRTRRKPDIPETLPAAAHPCLEAIGIRTADPRLGLRPQFAMASAWGSDWLTTRHSICNPAGPGWFVDRARFDDALIAEAAHNSAVPVTTARMVSVSRERNHWVLRFQGPGPEPLVVRAAVVVDATGRSSEFVRRIGLRRIVFDRLTAVSTRAVPREAVPGAALVESAPDGWWFSALKPEGELSISWFTEGRLLRASDRSPAVLEERLRATAHTASRVAHLLPGPAGCWPASTGWLEAFAGKGWLAVGDAAVTCDPLGSQGLHRSFESAAAAAELIVHDRTYDSKHIRDYCHDHIYYVMRFLRDRQAFYSLERRWPEAPFWRLVKR